MTNNRIIQLLIGTLIGLLLVGGYVAWQLYQTESAAEAQGGRVAAVSGMDLGGPFELVDHTGRTVTEADFAGRPMLIYFGFTYCPDVCPTELAQIAAATDVLESGGDEVTPVFITIDPERDTPELMADYVTLFHSDMVGLTGTDEQISEVARAFRVYYQRVESDDHSDYLMDHTSMVYLMGAEGENLLVFPANTPGVVIAEETRRALAG